MRFNHTAYVTVEGLRLTTAGASQTIDGSARKVAVWFDAAQNCRLTRTRLQLSGHTGSTEWVLLSGNSQFNRIDHNEFGPNNVDGHLIWPRGNPTIPGVTPPSDRTPWANGNGPVNPNIARHTLIDHNFFHDHLPTVTNGGEVIVLGGMGLTGDYQETSSIIEYNLFQDSWGDGELISVKTSTSTIRYNTIRRCGGGPVSRAGNKTHIYGNFLLQENRNGSGGIRIHEMDHLVFNNYIDNPAGTPVIVGDGDPYDQPGFSHAQVKRAKIFHNTFVSAGSPFDLGNAHPLDPLELVIANNIFVDTGFDGPQPLAGWIYAGNISFPSGPGRTGFTVVNPQLTTVSGLQKLSAGSPAIDAASAGQFPFLAEDMDGQARSGARDIGADEFSTGGVVRRPFTAADVGPNSPEGVVTTAWEAERLNRSASGAGASVTADNAAAGTFWVSFAADGAGDFIEFTLPNVPAGTYQLRLRYRSGPNRGTLQARLDGAVSGTSDQFTAGNQFLVESLGTHTFAHHGSHLVRLSVTGQNAASSGFTLSADALQLVPSTGGGQVVAPTFNPGGGTFATAQTVTISTSTAGASMRYTTDGSPPSSTAGTLVTGPVTISTTTTLRAIAFLSGMTDSPITTETYTISPTTGAILREAESIPFVTSGEGSDVVADGNASGGAWRALLADGVGDFIQYTLPDVPAGTYDLRLRFKVHPNRGTFGTSVNGASLPGTLDQYSATQSYREVSLGTVTLAASGNQTVRLTVTGRNPAAGAFTLSADAFRLVPGGPAPVSFEADALPRLASGAQAALQNDVNTTGGTWLALQADGLGDFIELTLPQIPAGTYTLRLSYKGHPNRGTLQASVDGTNLGGTLDQYSATSIYPTATIGTVTFATPASHVIRLTVAGRNPSAGAFTLSSDVFTLAPQ